MNNADRKISMQQALIFLFMGLLSPIIRLFPQHTAKIAGKAGWLAPIPALIPLIILIYIIYSFFKANQDANLSDIYCKILGNALGRVVVFLYLLWTLMLLCLYLRYYAERLLSSIIPNTSISFLLIALAIIVFYGARKGLVPVARANEIFIYFFMFAFLIVSIFGAPDIKFRNIMWVSYLDTLPVLKASYVITSIWGYFLYIFFLGDKINKQDMKRISFMFLIFLLVISIAVLIWVIGVLGPSLTAHKSLPFFIMVKYIYILDTIQGVESLLLALWALSDFAIVSLTALIATSIMKSLLSLKDSNALLSPVLLFGVIGALYVAKNRFELETFTNHVGLPINLLLTFIIPVLVFLVGKVRKII